MLLTVLLVVLLASLVAGGMGHSRYGYAGWSPAGILLVLIVVFFLSGHLRLR
jgi:hypothetical protein